MVSNLLYQIEFYMYFLKQKILRRLPVILLKYTIEKVDDWSHFMQSVKTWPPPWYCEIVVVTMKKTKYGLESVSGHYLWKVRSLCYKITRTDLPVRRVSLFSYNPHCKHYRPKNALISSLVTGFQSFPLENADRWRTLRHSSAYRFVSSTITSKIQQSSSFKNFSK